MIPVLKNSSVAIPIITEVPPWPVPNSADIDSMNAPNV